MDHHYPVLTLIEGISFGFFSVEMSVLAHSLLALQFFLFR